MKIPQPLQPLARALVAVESLFESSGQPGIIIGGVAICLCAEPRNTADIDASILLEGSSEAAILDSAHAVGLKPRIVNPITFARQNNIFLLTHTETGRDVDLSLAILPFEEDAIRTRRRVRLQGFEVHLPTVEHLAVMKAVAARANDLDDLRRLLRANPTLDRARVRRWVKLFATALDSPELLQQLQSIFKSVPSARRRRP
jgi:hypothetical protein